MSVKQLSGHCCSAVTLFNKSKACSSQLRLEEEAVPALGSRFLWRPIELPRGAETFALLRANVITGCTHHIASARGNLRRERHAEGRPLFNHQIWIASYLSGVFQISGAKLWELCVKPKLSITGRMLPGFGKQGSIKHFFIYFGRCREFCLYKFSLPIFIRQEKKKTLVCTQREQNKREQRKQRKGVTDSGNSRLGPEKQGLCSSAPACKALYWRGPEILHSELGLP